MYPFPVSALPATTIIKVIFQDWGLASFQKAMKLLELIKDMKEMLVKKKLEPRLDLIIPNWD